MWDEQVSAETSENYNRLSLRTDIRFLCYVALSDC